MSASVAMGTLIALRSERDRAIEQRDEAVDLLRAVLLDQGSIEEWPYGGRCFCDGCQSRSDTLAGVIRAWLDGREGVSRETSASAPADSGQAL